MLFQFSNALLFLVVGMGFVFAVLTISRILRPNKPTPEKQIPYECGEDPIGSPYIHFNIRFYVIALMFLIFEVEVAMLFPWGVTFRESGVVGLVKMLIFVSILLFGLVYAWGKGDLEWVGLPEKPMDEREQKGLLAKEVKQQEGILTEEEGQIKESSGVRMDTTGDT